jgi:tetratricopeptide (TPR) repeat protein
MPARKQHFRFAFSLTLLLGLLLVMPRRSTALDRLANPQDPPPASGKKPGANPKADSATKNAPDQPMYDPLRAEEDLKVGKYYMRKGDIDAAIDRFEDAISAKPGYALPFRFLAEAQEKKGLKKQAIKSYTRYLDLFPHADDAAKIQKRIDKLYREVEKEKKSAS